MDLAAALYEPSPGVFYYRQAGPVSLGAAELAFLVEAARRNEKRRARICAHPDTSAVVHEMLICLCRECYIRPHRHHHPESLHVVKGTSQLLRFNGEGQVTAAHDVSREWPEAAHFLRLPADTFHTLIVRSDYFLFHETTQGPFCRDDTEFAAWAPDEADRDRDVYLAELLARTAQLPRVHG